jgi:transcriptional regulator with XRE-family HTH domain
MQPYTEVRKLLLDKGLNVAQMARLMGEKPSYVYDVLKGRRAKKIRTSVKSGRGEKAAEIKTRVARFLGVSFEELWRRD